MELGLELRILGHPVALKIMEYMTKHSVFSAEELARAMEQGHFPVHVITFHLQALKAQGLVIGEFEPDGDGSMVKRYKVVPEKLQAVHEALGVIMRKD